MDKIQKFGLISLTIFSIITSLTFVVYHNCTLNNCSQSLVYIQYLHISIVSAAVVGILYSILLLRSLDKTVDKDVLENFKELLQDEKNEINKEQQREQHHSVRKNKKMVSISLF